MKAHIILIMGLMGFFSGCARKKQSVPNADLMPAPFDFVVTDHLGNPLITRQDQSIQLWYGLQGQKHYITDVKIKPVMNSGTFRYYATSVWAPLKSSENISKYFYLQLGEDHTDTIFLDVIRLSAPVEREYNKYNEVLYNGGPATLNKDHMPALYIFKRN